MEILENVRIRPDARLSQPVVCAIAQHVPAGRKNAISLEELASRSGYSTRAVRDAVELINETGALAIAREQTNGYYVPETAEELDAYIAYNVSYWNNFGRKVRGLREYRGRAFGSEY